MQSKEIKIRVPVIAQCKNCKKEFILGMKRTYCSKECNYAYQTKRHKIKRKELDKKYKHIKWDSISPYDCRAMWKF